MDLKQFDGHTPGPWAVHGNDVVADDGSVVADVAGGYWWRGKRPPFAANARLMAASPELLDEVRRLTAEADALRRERDELASSVGEARLQGRLEALAMAMTECGGLGGRDCREIRTAIDIRHLDTLRQMKTT